MEKFDALLKKIYSFLKKNGVSMCIRNRKGETFDEQIVIFATFVNPSFLKREKIKRWFRKTFKAVKSSLEEEFGNLPSLGFSYLDCGNEIKNFKVAITVRRSLYDPPLNFEIYAETTKHIIDQSTYWFFDPFQDRWIWREKDEKVQAQA